MLIRILLFSLALLNWGHCRPEQASFHSHAEAAEERLYQLSDSMLNATSSRTSCNSCISLLEVAKNLSFLSERWLVSSLIKICKRTGKVHPEVCHGVIEEQAPVLRKVLRTMSVTGRDGHLMCAAIMNACPYPEVEPWTLDFPKPKPAAIPKQNPSGKTLTVLHLSDWHIDTQYQPGAEVLCDKPICCRSAYTDYTNVTQRASLWGAYNCDTPITLIKSMLDFIPSVERSISFGILTGDIPPHEVWSTLPILKTQLIQEGTYSLLHTYFDSPDRLSTMLYPAVGNHEAAPTNIFPLKSSNITLDTGYEYLSLSWLYKALASHWRGWLSPGSFPNIETNMGSYIARPDPNGILTWLIEQLQESEDQQEKAWIIGHIAPGDNTCFHDYSNYYYQIVERYAPHVIVGQFFGHTHKDELQLFYRNGTLAESEAISAAYIAPSITPYHYLNPGFRVYKIDSETFEVVDSITYAADLDQAHSWDQGPNWHVEYSARQAYSPFAGHLPVDAPLSPAWWHRVTEAMESDVEAFATYWHYRTKSSPLYQECDDDCRANTVCGIRAGKSELRCDYDADVLFGKQLRPRYAPEESVCGLNMKSVHHRA